MVNPLTAVEKAEFLRNVDKLVDNIMLDGDMANISWGYEKY